MKKLIVFLVLSIAILPTFASPSNGFRERFLKKMLTFSEQNNAQILKVRHKLQRLSGVQNRSKDEINWVVLIAKQYDFADFRIGEQKDWRQLLSRVDIIPSSLLLAQGAIESAWGQSRFAKAGNNIFGQWCYTKGCGIVPLRRPQGATYEVQKFSSVGDSVRAYVHNLNTNRTYRTLRSVRAKLRAANKPLTGYALAAGLSGYSQRGQAYVGIVRGVISHYDLAKYNN